MEKRCDYDGNPRIKTKECEGCGYPIRFGDYCDRCIANLPWGIKRERKE